ncbi:MAG: histidine phosphatase family protein [Dehalococcoidia bacterium]
MRLLLIRHGETEHNAGRLALGRADVSLNERGLSQAQALATRLHGSDLYGHIDAVYASPLQRAQATASPLAEACGLAIVTETALIEMDIGALEGLSFPDVRERYPEFMRAWLSEDVADAEMPGGESLRQVQERAWAAVQSIRERHSEATVAAVTHNFVILTLLCRALDLPLSRFRRLRQDLGAVSTLDMTDARATAVVLNDTCHLEGSGVTGQESGA